MLIGMCTVSIDTREARHANIFLLVQMLIRNMQKTREKQDALHPSFVLQARDASRLRRETLLQRWLMNAS